MTPVASLFAHKKEEFVKKLKAKTGAAWFDKGKYLSSRIVDATKADSIKNFLSNHAEYVFIETYTSNIQRLGYFAIQQVLPTFEQVLLPQKIANLEGKINEAFARVIDDKDSKFLKWRTEASKSLMTFIAQHKISVPENLIYEVLILIFNIKLYAIEDMSAIIQEFVENFIKDHQGTTYIHFLKARIDEILLGLENFPPTPPSSPDITFNEFRRRSLGGL